MNVEILRVIKIVQCIGKKQCDSIQLDPVASSAPSNNSLFIDTNDNNKVKLKDNSGNIIDGTSTSGITNLYKIDTGDSSVYQMKLENGVLTVEKP